jgi:hypothetical protein
VCTRRGATPGEPKQPPSHRHHLQVGHRHCLAHDEFSQGLVRNSAFRLAKGPEALGSPLSTQSSPQSSSWPQIRLVWIEAGSFWSNICKITTLTTGDYAQMKATVSVGHASVLFQVPTNRLKITPVTGSTPLERSSEGSSAILVNVLLQPAHNVLAAARVVRTYHDPQYP